MDRSYYLDLAAAGLRMPIGTDLVLHRQPDPVSARLDGDALGAVMVESAERYRTPLAFPLMDLTLEKEWLLTGLGVPAAEAAAYHFASGPGAAELDALDGILNGPQTACMRASLGALDYVRSQTELVPVGMCIGPFSLMTKLLADPITAVYLISVDPDEPTAQAASTAMEVATRLIIAWVGLQAEAGAKAICICEPACSTAFISPHQIAAHDGLLDTLVLSYHRRIKQALEAADMDLILHDCGELTPEIVTSFQELDPAVLSLGSPSDLPSAAPLVPDRTVLFGNLPSKTFYSDSLMTVEQVKVATQELIARMDAIGHPYIIGSECDVLSVKGCEDLIMAKVMAMLEA